MAPPSPAPTIQAAAVRRTGDLDSCPCPPPLGAVLDASPFRRRNSLRGLVSLGQQRAGERGGTRPKMTIYGPARTSWRAVAIMRGRNLIGLSSTSGRPWRRPAMRSRSTWSLTPPPGRARARGLRRAWTPPQSHVPPTNSGFSLSQPQTRARAHRPFRARRSRNAGAADREASDAAGPGTRGQARSAASRGRALGRGGVLRCHGRGRAENRRSASLADVLLRAHTASCAGTNSATAPATAAGSSTGTHVMAPGTVTSVACGKSDASRRAWDTGKGWQLLAPDQRHRLAELRYHRGSVDEELRAEARAIAANQVPGHPAITPQVQKRRRISAPVAVEPARGHGGQRAPS